MLKMSSRGLGKQEVFAGKACSRTASSHIKIKRVLTNQKSDNTQ